MKQFENISHTADLQIRVYGATKKELFEHAVIGLFQSLGPRIVGCEKDATGLLICPDLPIQRTVQLASPDQESLLVDFLSEAVYLADVHNEAYLKAVIDDLTDISIQAKLYGRAVIGFDIVEVKAVTYHDLHIRCVSGVWQTDIVFDI